MQELILFLSQHQGPEFYVILTLALVASGCYFPISSDLTIITVTALSAATGLYHVPTLFFCMLIGILSGDMINFLVAKKYGVLALKSPRVRKVLKPEKVDQMTQLLKRSGEKFIFFVRFLPLVRTVLYFSAGLLQTSTWKFILYNGLSTNIYLTVLMMLSYRMGSDIPKLHSTVFQFEIAFAVVIVTLLGLTLLFSKSSLKK